MVLEFGVVLRGAECGHVKTFLTQVRPPEMWRSSWCWPHSSLKEATPTSAAIFSRLSSPSSGSSAMSVAAVSGPRPAASVHHAAALRYPMTA